MDLARVVAVAVLNIQRKQMVTEGPYQSGLHLDIRPQAGLRARLIVGQRNYVARSTPVLWVVLEGGEDRHAADDGGVPGVERAEPGADLVVIPAGVGVDLVLRGVDDVVHADRLDLRQRLREVGNRPYGHVAFC